MTEEGLTLQVHPILGQFPPSLAKAAVQPTAISSLTTNCETISPANIQLPKFIGDILAVSRKYLSFRRIFVEAAENAKNADRKL